MGAVQDSTGVENKVGVGASSIPANRSQTSAEGDNGDEKEPQRRKKSVKHGFRGEYINNGPLEAKITPRKEQNQFVHNGH